MTALKSFWGSPILSSKSFVAVARQARAAACAGALGVDGIVLGFLRDGRIDAAAMNGVLNAVPLTNATFHHAFDELPDPPAAIERLHAWPQIDRVLTSAGPGNWEQKASRIKAWSHAASPVALLAGGGVDVSAIRMLARSGAREAHVGRAARMPPTTEGAVSEQKVAELVEAAGQ